MPEQIKFNFEDADNSSLGKGLTSFKKEQERFLSGLERTRKSSSELAEIMEWMAPHFSQEPGAYLHPRWPDTAVVVLTIGEGPKERQVSLFFKKISDGEKIDVRRINTPGSVRVSELDFKIARAEAVRVFEEQRPDESGPER